MKITYEKLLQLNANVLRISSEHKDKLAYAVEQHLIPNIESALKIYNKEVGKIQIKYALTEKDTDAILYEPADKNGFRAYKFSKEGLEALERDVKLLKEKEIDFEPYIATQFGRALLFHSSIQELYNGILWNIEVKKQTEEDYNE